MGQFWVFVVQVLYIYRDLSFRELWICYKPTNDDDIKLKHIDRNNIKV